MSGGLAAYMSAMRAHESGGSGGYSAVNSLGYIGAYQMGEQFLVDIGWIVSDGVFDNSYGSYTWTSLSGVSTSAEFFESTQSQDMAFIVSLKRAWQYVRGWDYEHYEGQVLNGVSLTLSGMVAAIQNP
jgi:serralysin